MRCVHHQYYVGRDGFGRRHGYIHDIITLSAGTEEDYAKPLI
jgi:hypothetical protein